MHWTPSQPGPSGAVDVDRQFAGAIRLRAESGLAWIEIAAHPPVAFSMGDVASLFDEPDLADLGTIAVIAAPPMAYVVVGQGTLGLLDVTTGDYRSMWIDLERGELSEAHIVTLDGGDESFDAPRPGPMALVLTRVGR